MAVVLTRAVRAGWSRRAVLAAAGSSSVAVATGCSWLGQEPDPPSPDPLEPLLAETRELARRYQQTVAAHPELADQLGPLQEAHRAHEAALVALVDRPDLATAPSEQPAGPGGGPPADPSDAVAELRAAEEAGAASATATCLSAPPERVAMLGSIAAARATHIEVLA